MVDHYMNGLHAAKSASESPKVLEIDCHQVKRHVPDKTRHPGNPVKGCLGNRVVSVVYLKCTGSTRMVQIFERVV